MVTSVMGLDPERLNIFVRSLRRYSPATHLVVFVEQNTSHALLEANGAEVIPFKMEEGSALVLHRCAWGGAACRTRCRGGMGGRFALLPWLTAWNVPTISTTGRQHAAC